MLDNLGFFLLSRSNSESFYRDILILFIVVPLLKYFFDDISETYYKVKDFIFNKFNNKIEFIGWESINGGAYFYDYPLPMTAICHYLSKNNICQNIRYYNASRNGNQYIDDIISYKKDKVISYILNYGYNIKIEDDLYLDFNYHKMELSKESKTDGSWKVNIILKSKKKTIEEINKFVVKCIKVYEDHIDEKTKDKIYHFIYQGRTNDKKLSFTYSILSDFSDPYKRSYETFNNIYSDHKEMLIRDINRLKDIEYYKKTGNKRKKGYLFHGPPGCGKTSSVVAMALEDKRHILEISMSRIKTNEELEIIFNLTEIHGIKFEKNQIILLFDEIDTGTNILKKRKNEYDEDSDDSDTENDKLKEQTESKKDELITKLIMSKNVDNDSACSYNNNSDAAHLGCVLSRFDGVGCYSGLIIVATTNCKESLSPALYRNGRLNPVFFDYINKDNIIKIIEDYYQIKLTDIQKNKLPDKTSKLSYSSIRKYIEDFEDNIDNLLEFLETLKV